MLLKLTVILFIYISTVCNSTSAVDDTSPQTVSSTVASSTAVKVQTTAKVPTINYECTKEKWIKLDQNTDISKLSVLMSNKNPCNLNGTTLNNCGITKGAVVTLIWQNENHTKVYGGHDSRLFTLTCTDVGVYSVTNGPDFDVLTPTAGISLTQPAYHDIALTLFDKNNKDVSSNSVDMGQELEMKMEISDKDYVLSPIDCTAKGSDTETYKIWQKANDCKHDSSVIVKTWNGTDQSALSITMYGFFFPNSKHVTIECTTQVCNKTAAVLCNQNCMTTNRRRRRDVKSNNEKLLYVKSVEVSFDVVLNEAGVNSAIGILPTKQVLALIGITVYTVMQII